MNTEASQSARDRLPITQREIALIVAFWLLYALVTLANRSLDLGGMNPPPIPTLESALAALGEAVCWIILTPVIFRLTS